MPTTKKMLILFSILTLSAISWIGCSDDTIVRYVDQSEDGSQFEPVESYFPLNEGYTTNYYVIYQSGGSEQVSFEAGQFVSFQGIEAVEWIGRSSNSVDTGYFYANNSSLYYFDTKSSEPEKVLQLPLSTGASWQTNEINSNDFTDIITGSDGDNTDTNAKDFPTISAVNFTVEAIESLQLESGNYYSQTVRLSTPNGTRMNYYWYASGVGLVKYVIGATSNDYAGAEAVGEITASGY